MTRRAPVHGLRLGPMFHWSPIAARPQILRRGLLPKTPSGPAYAYDPEGDIRYAVCLAADPATAWAYSVEVLGDKGLRWDLWQVTLVDDDEVHPLPCYGPHMIEIRVANRIPKSRCWHVGTRES